MTARTARGLAWGLWFLALGMVFVGVFLGVRNGSFSEDPGFLSIAFLSVISYGTVGALIAARTHGNPIGWLMLAMGLGFIVGGSMSEYAIYGLVTEPGSLPLAAAMAWAGQLAFMAITLAVPLTILLFPGGRLPSPRWRPVAWLIVGSTAVLGAAVALQPELAVTVGVSVSNPIRAPALEAAAPVATWVGGLGIFGGGVLAVAGLIVRFRRSRREERQQLRWLAAVAALAFIFLLGTLLTAIGLDPEASPLNDFFFFAFFLSILVGVPTAVGVAVLKYRLYDLDIVVNKTVVYLVLAAFITAVYVLVVVGIPVLLFGAESGFSFLPFAAAAVIALAFQPVRRRVSRLANRLVYGKRATPYEVLSEFSAGMSGTYMAEDVLPTMARLLGEGTGAARANVWLRVGQELRPAAGWPEARDGRLRPIAVSEGDLPPIPGAEEAFPVRHHGELLGALTVGMPRGETFTPANRKLVEDLASQAGLVLRNVRLIEELRASRQRIVAAQDEERRRLERNIHDGAQQLLVALGVKLRLVEATAPKDPARATEMAAQARSEVQEALDTLRDLARGIYPPLLADQGLAVALEGQARKSPVPVEVEPDGIGRYPAEVEAGVYFCVLEALQNVAKYAKASRAVVRLWSEDGDVVFAVQDDGRGFDPETTAHGSGLQNMADRLEALGGSITISAAPGRGTTVTGRIPLRGESA